MANRVRLSLFILAYNLGKLPSPVMSAQGGQALVAAERAGQADQDGRSSGAALPAIDLSVVRGVGSSTVVPGSVGSYRPVIAGAKLREGITTILPRGRALQGVGLSSMRFHPIGGGPKTTKMDKKHGFTARNRIPYWIDRRLNGPAGPDYDAIISFGLPFEPEDSQYGEYRNKRHTECELFYHTIPVVEAFRVRSRVGIDGVTVQLVGGLPLRG